MPTQLDPANTPTEALAGLPDALALGELEEVDAEGVEFDVPTRLEPRRNSKGKLRGIAWRERNVGRKGVWYVGARSEGQRKKQWQELKGQFEGTANTGLEGGNDPDSSVGSELDGSGSVGIEQTGEILQ